MIPIRPELQEILEDERVRFRDIYGRLPRSGDSLFLKHPDPDYIYFKTASMMQKADLPPDKIYAYLRTGLLVWEGNLDLIPDKDLQEWQDAIDEYWSDDTSEDQDSVKKNAAIFKKLELLEDYSNRIIIILDRFLQHFGEAKNILTNSDGEHTHHDFIMLCIARSLKSLRALDHLLSDCYGEDALVLARAVYENYLATSFLLRSPEKIHDLVTARVRLLSGDCERVKVVINGRKRRVIRDIKTGQIFDANIEIRKMAENSLDQGDIEIHTFLYSYLSDYSHPTIFSLERYLNEGYFNTYKFDSHFHAMLYGCYSGTVMCECLLSFKDLKPLFKRDIKYIINKAADCLIKIFSELKGSSGHETSPKQFQERLERMKDRIAQATH